MCETIFLKSRMASAPFVFLHQSALAVDGIYCALTTITPLEKFEDCFAMGATKDLGTSRTIHNDLNKLSSIS